MYCSPKITHASQHTAQWIHGCYKASNLWKHTSRWSAIQAHLDQHLSCDNFFSPIIVVSYKITFSLITYFKQLLYMNQHHARSQSMGNTVRWLIPTWLKAREQSARSWPGLCHQWVTERMYFILHSFLVLSWQWSPLSVFYQVLIHWDN